MSNVSSDFFQTDYINHSPAALERALANESTGSQFSRGQTKCSELLEMGKTPDLTINKVSSFHLSYSKIPIPLKIQL